MRVRRLEQTSITIGLGVAFILAVLSALNLFSPYSCPSQGLVGLVAALILSILTSPLAVRRGGGGRRAFIVHVAVSFITVLMAWPVFHTVILLFLGGEG
ncbi:MAG: hypothetical protein F7C35_07120 [Desulfurococcales archaeon]|nr:hypothetical protein [Desulfurococcales archaeon]